ncbi:IS3 family transposase [Amycolatopsis sp. GM8]|uniref:IS3 family transposase n=1 Tax=Amycolatopsis sp. GM8 TaxID=2896530 RepID=UPI0035AB7A74
MWRRPVRRQRRHRGSARHRRAPGGRSRASGRRRRRCSPTRMEPRRRRCIRARCITALLMATGRISTPHWGRADRGAGRRRQTRRRLPSRPPLPIPHWRGCRPSSRAGCWRCQSRGFYAWRSRSPSARSIRHAWLTDVITDIHQNSRGRYGARRVHAELRLGRGILVGHGAVEMLMRRARLVGAMGGRGGSTPSPTRSPRIW